MKRVELRDLNKTYKDFSGKTITVCGWARTVRDSKNIAFVELNDGAFKSVQIVVEKFKITTRWQDKMLELRLKSKER